MSTTKQYRSFSSLPKSWRTAYHGTTSLFLDDFKKGGIRVFRHPILEEIRGICKEIMAAQADPEKAEKWLGSINRLIPPGMEKSDAWKVYWQPVAEYLVAPDQAHLYMTGEIASATVYASYAPEFRLYLFEEFPKNFENGVAAVFKGKFDSLLKRLGALKFQFSALYANAHPIVLEVEIPDFTYLHTQIPEEELIEQMKSHMEEARRGGVMSGYFRDITPMGKEFLLAKTLDWGKVLDVHEVNANIALCQAASYYPTLYSKHVKSNFTSE